MVPDGGGVFEQNVEKYKSHQPVNTPIFVTMQEQNSKGEAFTGYSDLHKETFNLLKDRYTYVPFNEIKDTDIVINNYGEPVHSDHRGNNFDEGVYHFLKNLFSFETDNSKHKGRRYYISRNKSHNLAGNSGVVRRHIVNEDEFSTLLESYGFEKFIWRIIQSLKKLKYSKTQTQLFHQIVVDLCFLCTHLMTRILLK